MAVDRPTMRPAVACALWSWPMAFWMASGPSSGASSWLMASTAVRYSRARLSLPVCRLTCSEASRICALRRFCWPWLLAVAVFCASSSGVLLAGTAVSGEAGAGRGETFSMVLSRGNTGRQGLIWHVGNLAVF